SDWLNYPTATPPPRTSKDKGAHNGLRTDPLSNGQEEKRDTERQSRAQDPNHNTEPSLQPVSPAARLKAEGNQLFKNGQFGEAAATDSQELGILYSNRAACQLKKGNSRDCESALQRDASNIKTLYRRAQDLHETLAQDPGNLSVLALVAEITPVPENGACA
uniref:Uncharacterized protein n=1 Tax=Leptobrachium leishanense TaxID=445787 RepID=A0A8C5LRP0_9ANUR